MTRKKEEKKQWVMCRRIVSDIKKKREETVGDVEKRREAQVDFF